MKWFLEKLGKCKLPANIIQCILHLLAGLTEGNDGLEDDIASELI